MKNKTTLIRIFAILLLLAFAMLVFSAITFGTHHCEHETSCSICAYQIEHRSELFIPVLCACAVILSLVLSLSFVWASDKAISIFTPVKLKVKLSD